MPDIPTTPPQAIPNTAKINRAYYSVSAAGTYIFSPAAQSGGTDAVISVSLGGRDIPQTDTVYPWFINDDGDVEFSAKQPAIGESVEVIRTTPLDFNKIKFPKGYPLDARVLNRTLTRALEQAQEAFASGDEAWNAWLTSNNVPAADATDERFLITDTGSWSSKLKIQAKNILNLQNSDDVVFNNSVTLQSAASATNFSATNFTPSSFDNTTPVLSGSIFEDLLGFKGPEFTFNSEDNSISSTAPQGLIFDSGSIGLTNGRYAQYLNPDMDPDIGTVIRDYNIIETNGFINTWSTYYRRVAANTTPFDSQVAGTDGENIVLNNRYLIGPTPNSFQSEGNKAKSNVVCATAPYAFVRTTGTRDLKSVINPLNVNSLYYSNSFNWLMNKQTTHGEIVRFQVVPYSAFAGFLFVMIWVEFTSPIANDVTFKGCGYSRFTNSTFNTADYNFELANAYYPIGSDYYNSFVNGINIPSTQFTTGITSGKPNYDKLKATGSNQVGNAGEYKDRHALIRIGGQGQNLAEMITTSTSENANATWELYFNGIFMPNLDANIALS